MMPSFRIANGSPFRVENTITIPQKVPGSTQYFSTVLPSGHSSMSDFIRVAKVSKERQAPSMGPQRYTNSGSWGPHGRPLPLLRDLCDSDEIRHARMEK